MLLRTPLYFDNSISTTPIHATSQFVGNFLHALQPTRARSVCVCRYVKELSLNYFV